MHRVRFLPLILLIVLMGIQPARALAAGAKPNIILIFADDLGFAELGSYGQKKILTPHLDRMATQGMRFTQHYSASPVCAPARCGLMTGKHGGHALVRDNKEIKPEGQAPLPASEVTLAELLKKQGYATGAMGKWGLGAPGSEGDPIKKGFDLFYGYNCQRHAHNHYPLYLWRNDKRIELPPDATGKLGLRHSHDLIEEEALKFIRDRKDGPFFLYLPFPIPHMAMQAEPEWLDPYRGKFPEQPYVGGQGYRPHPTPHAAYAGMVSRLDQSVGRILALLADLKIDDNTLVIFSSDNGGTHGRVGGADSAFFDSAGGLRGLKGDVYEGGIRVPMIARWPGRIQPGSVSDLPSYLPDYLPTFMEVAGAADRIPAGLDGISFLPTLLGRAADQKKHDYLFWEFHGYGGQQALRMGEWKAVRRNMLKGNLKIELYNLKDDPKESKDLAAAEPDRLARMKSLIESARTPSPLFPFKPLDGN